MTDWSTLEIEAAALSHAEKIAALPVSDQPEATGRWLRFAIDQGLRGDGLSRYQRALTGAVYRARQERREAETCRRLP